MKNFIQWTDVKFVDGLLGRIVCFLLLATLSTQTLAIWDEEALEKAAQQAREQVSLLANNQGDLYKSLGDNQSRQSAIAQMQFNNQGKISNQAHVYQYLAERTGSEYNVGLYYAAAQESHGANRSRNLLETYKQIIYADYYSQKFALDKLRSIASNFTDKQYKEYQRFIEYETLSVSDVEINRDQEYAEICLRFNKPITSEPEQQWRSLITIDPKPNNDGVYQGSDICYTADWQTAYDISVSPEIISDNNIPLAYHSVEGYREVVYTGDRNAMVRLGTKGQTIIARDEAALTVESANVDTVGVRVWTVPVTNLSQKDIAQLLNSSASNSYYFGSANLRHNARLIYEGEFDPKQDEANETVASQIRLTDMGINEAGIYIVRLDSPLGNALADQIAFSVAQAGFSAYKTDDGLWAELRDLRDFSPVSNAQVALYSRDNTVLATAKTNRNGIASFAQAAIIGEGGATPDHLIYQNNNSLAYLYLDHQGHDLSDKGLDNRDSQADIQSWLWLDRGVYRPNDTLHALWLLRHNETLYTERDLWLELSRPDGTIVHEQKVTPDASGAYHFDYDFANTARLGPWQLTLLLGKDAQVIDQSLVRVDAIIAQQIETELQTVSLAPTIELSLQADWLYGSPAKGLRTSGEWQATWRDWPEYKGWQFGRHDEEIDQQTIHFNTLNTNAQGERMMTIEPSLIPASTRPLSLAVKASVFTDDGQVINAEQSVDVIKDKPYVGLKVNNSQASVVLLEDDGSLVSETLDWQLYRVHRNGYWYRTENYWEYQYSDRKTLAESGQLTTNTTDPSRLDLPVDDGLWLLEVSGDDSSVMASTMIEFGSWTMATDGASPETLTLTSDKQRYADGDEVSVNIRAPFDGIGSVKLAHGNIFKVYNVEFKDHEATLTFKWDEEWSQGIWLLASAWQERQDQLSQPQRAVGLTWLGSEFAHAALQPTIDAPAEIKPDGQLSLTVDVPQAEDDTWVNVAVIDEGLYRLAPPSFHDPLLTFYGKTPWALALYDIWGQIIRQTDAAVASLRSGAGNGLAGPGLADLPNIDTPLITYWSNPQRVVDGKVSLEMDVPRFHGKLRVMALAYNDDKLGIAEGEVIVKEDVVSNLYVPLYASVNDQSQARIRLHNTTQDTQTVEISMASSGLNMESLQEDITLDADEERWIEQPFTVRNEDKASVEVTINDATITQDIDIRPEALSVLRKDYLSIAPGQTMTVPMGSAYHLGGLGIDYDDIAEQLANYPYYCSEQTASRLFSAVNAGEADKVDLYATQTRLINLQQNDGSFTLWRGSDGYDIWLSTFVGEALLRAKESEVLALDRPLNALLSYLRNEVSYAYAEDGGYGYAHYLLAKAGVNMQGAAIRYTSRLQEPTFDSDNLEAVLALYLYGENERAQALWQKLQGNGQPVSHYQTGLSELAKRLHRLHELSEYRDVSTEIGQTMQSLRTELDGQYSTQEMVWLNALAEFEHKSTATINGEEKTFTTLSAFANDDTTITNESDASIALTITDRVDGDPDALIEQGYSIAVTYTDFDGKLLDAAHLPSQQKVLVKVRIRREEQFANRDSEIMFVYPFAAGEQAMQWEANGEYFPPAFSENRDDRHLAAFTMYEGKLELNYEFALRTAREGTWHAPGMSVEDMYRPDLKAQYPTRTVTIDDQTETGDDQSGLTLQSLATDDEKSGHDAVRKAIAATVDGGDDGDDETVVAGDGSDLEAVEGGQDGVEDVVIELESTH